MGTAEIVQALQASMEAAEQVLLRIEELELLVTNDRPRRLIDIAQEELARAVELSTLVWEQHEEGLAKVASSSEDPEVRQCWVEFRSLLAHSARRAAQASLVLAKQIAVTDDVLAALGFAREYGQHGALRRTSAVTTPTRVLA